MPGDPSSSAASSHRQQGQGTSHQELLSELLDLPYFQAEFFRSIALTRPVGLVRHWAIAFIVQQLNQALRELRRGDTFCRLKLRREKQQTVSSAGGKLSAQDSKSTSQAESPDAELGAGAEDEERHAEQSDESEDEEDDLDEDEEAASTVLMQIDEAQIAHGRHICITPRLVGDKLEKYYNCAGLDHFAIKALRPEDFAPSSQVRRVGYSSRRDKRVAADVKRDGETSVASKLGKARTSVGTDDEGLSTDGPEGYDTWVEFTLIPGFGYASLIEKRAGGGEGQSQDDSFAMDDDSLSDADPEDDTGVKMERDAEAENKNEATLRGSRSRDSPLHNRRTKASQAASTSSKAIGSNAKNQPATIEGDPDQVSSELSEGESDDTASASRPDRAKSKGGKGAKRLRTDDASEEGDENDLQPSGVEDSGDDDNDDEEDADASQSQTSRDEGGRGRPRASSRKRRLGSTSPADRGRSSKSQRTNTDEEDEQEGEDDKDDDGEADEDGDDQDGEGSRIPSNGASKSKRTPSRKSTARSAAAKPGSEVEVTATSPAAAAAAASGTKERKAPSNTTNKARAMRKR